VRAWPPPHGSDGPPPPSYSGPPSCPARRPHPSWSRTRSHCKRQHHGTHGQCAFSRPSPTPVAVGGGSAPHSVSAERWGKGEGGLAPCHRQVCPHHSPRGVRNGVQHQLALHHLAVLLEHASQVVLALLEGGVRGDQPVITRTPRTPSTRPTQARARRHCTQTRTTAQAHKHSHTRTDTCTYTALCPVPEEAHSRAHVRGTTGWPRRGCCLIGGGGGAWPTGHER
jgi:hypothetical protein